MTTTANRPSFRFIAGIVLVVIGIIAALSGGLFIPRVSSEQRLFVLDPGDSLRVEGHNGTITIETWQGDEVVIEVNKEARALFKGLADWIERESIDWIHDDNGLQVVSRVSGGGSSEDCRFISMFLCPKIGLVRC